MDPKIIRIDQQRFEGRFIHANFINNNLKEINWIVYPKTPLQFEEAANELRFIRKAMWPGYNDATNNETTIDTTRHFGTVKWYNDATGCGRLTEDEIPQKKIFLHFTDILSEGFRSVKEGERVSFELIDGPQGLQARNVKKCG